MLVCTLLALCQLCSAFEHRDCFTPLHLAAESGDESGVRNALESYDANTDDLCETKVYPLMLAAHSGCLECVSLLLDAGAIPSVRHHAHGATPLISAASQGHGDVVQALLSHGAQVDERDDRNLTALWFACEAGRTSAVRHLLAAGADPTIRAHTGVTPVMLAKHAKHVAVLEMLSAALSGGGDDADPDELWLTGRLPLPLENSRPFESFLLGPYAFDRLIGGASEHNLTIRERTLPGAARRGEDALSEDEREDLDEARRVASLFMTVPTPVYRKRGAAKSSNLRLWFDPGLAMWLVSQVGVASRGGKWEERGQFLRAQPASVTSVDAALAERWQVRLVAADASKTDGKGRA